MKRPGFLQGAAVALVLAVTAAALHAALGWLVDEAAALRIVVTGVAAAYVLYLLSRAEDRVGRFAVAVAWLAAAFAIAFAPTFLLFLVAHVVAAWLARALYFHAGVLPALADLALSFFALAAAAWAATTGSLFLTVWTFFLVTAFFVAIPETARGSPRAIAVGNDDFLEARRSAEAALRRIASGR